MDKKIPDVSCLIKKTDFNAKITEVEGKIPSISGLATSSELTVVENKIPDAGSLVRKTDYDTKISDIDKKVTDHDHDKYLTTPEFNTLAASVFNARLVQVDLVTKTDFDAKLRKISDRVTSSKCKHLLVENEFKKLEKFDAAYFRGKNYFDSNDGTQNCIVFEQVKKYLEVVNNDIKSWKSKELSDEKISSITGFEYPNLRHYNSRINVKLDGSVLKQSKIARFGSIVNIYVVYRLASRTNNSNKVLKNCLFGAMEMKNTSNPDPDKYKYSGYAIGFDSKEIYTRPYGGYGKNVIIFSADMSNSKHANNKTKNVLVLDCDFVQKINDTTIYAERMYSPNFTVENKTFFLSLHYNGDNSYLFVNGKEVIKFKS